ADGRFRLEKPASRIARSDDGAWQGNACRRYRTRQCFHANRTERMKMEWRVTAHAEWQMAGVSPVAASSRETDRASQPCLHACKLARIISLRPCFHRACRTYPVRFPSQCAH